MDDLQIISSQSVLDGLQGVQAQRQAGQNLVHKSGFEQPKTNPFDDQLGNIFRSMLMANQNRPDNSQLIDQLQKLQELLKKQNNYGL